MTQFSQADIRNMLQAFLLDGVSIGSIAVSLQATPEEVRNALRAALMERLAVLGLSLTDNG